MPSPVLVWTSETPDLFTANTGDACGRRPVYVVAEAMAGGGWDWAAWSSHGGSASFQGVELNRTRAMKQAELAAWTLKAVEKVTAA